MASNNGKKLFFWGGLLPLLLLFFSLMASASVYFGQNFTNYITEDFEYVSSFAVRGWTRTQTGTCTGIPTTPVNLGGINASMTYGWGVNATLAACTWDMRKTSLFNATSRIILEFDAVIGSSNYNSSNYISILLGHYQGVWLGTLYLRIPYDTLKMTVHGVASGTICTVSTPLNESMPVKVLMDWDRQNGKVSIYYNGQPTNCYLQNVQPGDMAASTTGMMILGSQPIAASYSYGIDNIFLESSATAVNASENAPCSTNAQCDSGFCLNGACQLKFTGASCSANKECQSGECLNGKCTMPSMSQGLTAFKNQFFGKDSATSDLVSLMLMLVVAGAVAYMLHSWGASGGIVGVAFVAVYFMTGFGFAVLGWLSTWIIFGMIFLGIVGTVVMLLFRGTGQGGG